MFKRVIEKFQKVLKERCESRDREKSKGEYREIKTQLSRKYKKIVFNKAKICPPHNNRDKIKNRLEIKRG